MMNNLTIVLQDIDNGDVDRAVGFSEESFIFHFGIRRE